MDAIIIKYYGFQYVLNKLPNEIKEKLSYDDSLLFSLISFKSSPRFYSKKDKYDIFNKINNESFKNIIIDSTISLFTDNDFNKLLFLYGLVISDEIDNYLNQYLNQISKDYSLNESINMADKIIADKYEFNTDDLIKNYPDSFIYYDYMDELIHLLFIKYYNFFGSTNYFKIAYRKMKKFYKNKTKPKIFNLEINESRYFDKYSTVIFNKNREEYIINNKNYHYDFNDFIDFIYSKIYDKINAINAFLFDNINDLFIKEYNIDPDIKI